MINRCAVCGHRYARKTPGACLSCGTAPAEPRFNITDLNAYAADLLEEVAAKIRRSRLAPMVARNSNWEWSRFSTLPNARKTTTEIEACLGPGESIRFTLVEG